MEDTEAERDATAVAIQNRITSSLPWQAPPFARIIDLKEAHYEETLRLIKHHFFREEPMCKASFLLNDTESVKAYLELIRMWMKDTTSIVALSVRSGRVIGTAITRINSSSDRTNTYSRVQLFQGETLQKIMNLKSTLVKQAQPFKTLNKDTIYRIYILCVHPTYRHRGLATALLEACVQISATLKIPAVAGVFTSGVSQSLASDLGFQIISEMRYSRWIINNRVVFDNPGQTNYSAAFMAMIVPGPEELEQRRRARKSLYKKMTILKYLQPP